MTDLNTVNDRMAHARAARGQKKPVEPPAVLDPALLAAARAQRQASDIAERDLARQQAAQEQREAKARGDTPRPDPVGPSPAEKAAMKQSEEARAREEAARARFAAPQSADTVLARITRQGDGRISTGFHADGIGEVHHPWKQPDGSPTIIPMSRDTAEALQARYFVEIEG